jgi:hypothetical protein
MSTTSASTSANVSSSLTGGSAMAQRTWQMANNMQSLDAIYNYDDSQQQAIRTAKPWEKEYARLCYCKRENFRAIRGKLEFAYFCKKDIYQKLPIMLKKVFPRKFPSSFLKLFLFIILEYANLIYHN